MTVKIIHGNCYDVLRALEEGSVHSCVTSPPYWGLRDYGTWPVRWPAISYHPMPGLPHRVRVPAMEASLGLEPTLEAFIGHMLLVFRQVRRVLRDDGTAWVNMGDSYAGSRQGPQGADSTLAGNGHQGGGPKRLAVPRPDMVVSRRRDDEPIQRSDRRIPGLKPKDLVGQPWRLALALQADGWWLRQDIIWGKPNPMPESARDRCTKAHEYVFLLAKSEQYYYDFAAMQEPTTGGAKPRRSSNGVGFGHGFDADARQRGRIKVPSGWDTAEGDHRTLAGRYSGEKDAGRDEQGLKASERFGRAPGWRKVAEPGQGIKNNTSFEQVSTGDLVETRNRRSVWWVQSEPFKEAHFATFPTALIEPCIRAGCPVGGTVLDPFGGAGTTGLVADRLQRDAILIELNPEYAAIAQQRITGDAPLFAEVEQANA